MAALEHLQRRQLLRGLDGGAVIAPPHLVARVPRAQPLRPDQIRRQRGAGAPLSGLTMDEGAQAAQLGPVDARAQRLQIVGRFAVERRQVQVVEAAVRGQIERR